MCFKLSAIDEVSDVGQTLTGNLDQKKCCFDAEESREILIGLGNGGNELASSTKDLKRSSLYLATNQIDDRVHISHFLLEVLGLKVDGRVRTEVSNSRNIVRRRRRNHSNVCLMSQLHRVGANVTCGSVNKYCLARLEFRLIK